MLITWLVPPESTIVFGADDTVERRSGRKITAKGCYRDAVHSTKKHVIRCFGLKWVSMMLLVPVPWSRRVWALPFLTALCWPAAKGKRQRSLQAWAERSDTPWEAVDVNWYGGQRKQLWVFSHIALWYTPGMPPATIRYVLVCDPGANLGMGRDALVGRGHV